MLQCPNCRAEHAPGARFCAECGARLDQPPATAPDQPTAPGRAAAEPTRPTGKETIVLRAPELAPTERLPNPAFTDKTIVAGGAGSPVDAPTAPGGAASTPTSALPAPVYRPPPNPVPPPQPAAPAPKASGSRMWIVIAMIALLGLGLVGALVGGLLLIMRSGGTVALSPTSDVGGGLARLPTAAPRPTATLRPTATARPTVAPTPTAAPDRFSKIVLEDDFSDPKHSSLTEDKTDNATYSFVDGAYAINLKTPKYIVWSPLEGDYSDAAIEVDTTFESGPAENAVGILFHFQDADNFYFFSISGSGSYSLDLYTKDGRQALIDWTDSPAIRGQGQPNRLRVETEGDRIRLFVNQTLLDEVSDSTFSKGALALAVNTFSKGDAGFTFDNLVVRTRK